ncbi:MAG: helix-hairpin-helix domain-containing protein, partial [Bacteroidota bacterium]|nr:helix-hairpin-helix domain-containing protein [Bacteroidota bacterium]
GIFKKKEDLKKIYSISDKQYQKYEKFIVIDEKLPDNESPIEKIEFVELNSATTKQLSTLPSVQNYLAERIIKYRNLLGGFYSSQQLKEVYGFKDKNYTQIKNYLTIDLNKIKKININFAEYKEIISHPYIDKKITLSILNYKQKNGFYSSLNQLVKNNVLSKEEYEKLKYYLSVE